MPDPNQAVLAAMQSRLGNRNGTIPRVEMALQQADPPPVAPMPAASMPMPGQGQLSPMQMQPGTTLGPGNRPMTPQQRMQLIMMLRQRSQGAQ